jgi:DnaK suppressor protein
MDEQQARALLSRERRRIEQALAELEDVAVAQQLRDELAAIERAEARLRDGTYGRSVDSGRPIPDARLELIPWAERTAEEQERFERGR